MSYFCEIIFNFKEFLELQIAYVYPTDSKSWEYKLKDLWGM